HDAYTCSLAEADRSFESSCTFTAARAGRMSALAAWFDAELGPGVSLTNAVGAPDTHWGRFIFPLHRPIEIREGAQIKTHARCDPATQGGCAMYWSVQIDDGALEE